MKRLLMLYLSLVLFVSVIPLQGFAVAPVDSDFSHRGEVSDTANWALEAAVAAFPEYADKIRGEQTVAFDALQACSGSDEIVIQETRWVSEQEAITYTEYESGLVLTSGLFNAGKNVTGTSSGSGYYSGTMNIWMNCAGSSQILMVNGVTYTLPQGGYGYIENRGTISSLSDVSSPMYGGFRRNGSAGNPAYSEYTGVFTVYTSTGGEPNVTLFYGTLRIEVGASSYTLSAFPG